MNGYGVNGQGVNGRGVNGQGVNGQGMSRKGLSGKRGGSPAASEVVIVGAGVAGCTLAYELARRGVAARLLDAGTVGRQGGSSVPVALLNPHRGRTGRARAEDVAGLAAFWALADRLESDGHASGARRGGVLRVASSPRQARMWRSSTGVTWREPEQVDEQLHAPFGAMFVPSGGWVEPAVLLASLVEAALARGALLHERARVTRIEGKRLHTTIGTFHAEQVVLCTGVERVAGVTLPSFTAVGGEAVLLAWDRPALLPLAGAVNAAFHARGVWVTGGHTSLCGPGANERSPNRPGTPRPGATETITPRPNMAADAASDIATDTAADMATDVAADVPPNEAPDPAAGRPATEPLRDALAWSLSAIGGAAVLERWHGARARAASPYPVVETVADGVTYYGSLAGRGFLCAADLSAKLAARLVAALNGA